VPVVVYNGTFSPYVLLQGLGKFGFYSISTVIGSSGADVLVGGSGTNLWTITGVNAGQESALVFSGIEFLVGGAGMDIFRFTPTGGITGSIYGQGGGDWLDYSSFSTGVTVNLTTGTATHVFGQVFNVQNVFGGTGNDTLVGNSLGNVLMGGAGNDTIIGGSGRSVLIGGSGSDIIVGGSSDDIIIGGSTFSEGGPVSPLPGPLPSPRSGPPIMLPSMRFLPNGSARTWLTRLGLPT
jgi:Ca2+-binding RTX toxin-like protein